MPEIKIIDEVPLTLEETKELLEKIEKRDKELNEKSIKTREYINKLVKKSSQGKEIKKKLEEANIGRLKPRHIAKIVDIMPKDVDSIKALFTGENITLKQEDLKKVLECLQ